MWNTSYHYIKPNTPEICSTGNISPKLWNHSQIRKPIRRKWRKDCVALHSLLLGCCWFFSYFFPKEDCNNMKAFKPWEELCLKSSSNDFIITLQKLSIIHRQNRQQFLYLFLFTQKVHGQWKKLHSLFVQPWSCTMSAPYNDQALLKMAVSWHFHGDFGLSFANPTRSGYRLRT